MGGMSLLRMSSVLDADGAGEPAAENGWNPEIYCASPSRGPESRVVPFQVFKPRWCRLSLEARESVNWLPSRLSVQLNRFPSVNVTPIHNSLKWPIFDENESIFGWDVTKYAKSLFYHELLECGCSNQPWNVELFSNGKQFSQRRTQKDIYKIIHNFKVN